MNRREIAIAMARLAERIDGLDRLTDAKFVTFRTLVDSQADKVKLALDASKEAITKAESATEKRFDSVNEFRQALADQTTTFASRREVESNKEQVTLADEKLDQRLKALEQNASNLQGRFWALGAVVIVVNLAIALFVR